MKKRKKNPYQLTDEEKLAVVDLYAQFQTTSQIVDQVMGWKSHATTGDTEKDRKYVRDAIRTCNPKSTAFSFQVSLTARRAEYLAEQKGTLVAAVCDTAQALAEALSSIKFDFSSVSVNDLPKIVSALKEVSKLMEGLGIKVNKDISQAVRFGEQLNQDSRFCTSEKPPETEAMLEAYELGRSTQIETDTGRSADDIHDDTYPSNYVIPDVHVKELWKKLCSSENGKTPTVKQMRKDLDNPKLYEEVYGEESYNSFEERLDHYRSLLPSD